MTTDESIRTLRRDRAVALLVVLGADRWAEDIRGDVPQPKGHRRTTIDYIRDHVSSCYSPEDAMLVRETLDALGALWAVS